jgi:hypothetical protein
MSWIDKLEEQGKRSVKDKRKREPRPPVQEVIVSVRNPSETDPGEVAIGHFIVQGDTVTLTDENGTPLDEKEGTAKIGDANPISIASVMLRKRWEATRGGDFNRRIVYANSGWS